MGAQIATQVTRPQLVREVFGSMHRAESIPEDLWYSLGIAVDSDGYRCSAPGFGFDPVRARLAARRRAIEKLETMLRERKGNGLAHP